MSRDWGTLGSETDFVKAYGHNGTSSPSPASSTSTITREILAACTGDLTEAQALAAHCWPAPEVSENINTMELGNLGLTPAEEQAIVAFLKTLSDGYVP